ncbi:cytochrome oxidase complex assembly protein [Rhizoctonia solani AG-3 Rhs1AP]|uniref:Cytochrome oxidase complex assembly protein n=1 Tax=Rhizoctonia solani AG-3 Rhs1AP TaxID=1086054 RepID=X8JWP7_9AGAM|nr:cytochrome oxidase complex assembly protein [Rhizoctonia solani AG-3 Rhs1AP]
MGWLQTNFGALTGQVHPWNPVSADRFLACLTIMYGLARSCSPLNHVPHWSRGLSSSWAAYAKLDLKPPPPGPLPPPPVNFDAPSRPRPVYERPQPKELPIIRSRAPAFIGLGLLGVSAWAGFIVYAMNQERLASSVTKQVLTQIRASPEVASELGPGVVAEPTWWMMGQPYIDGGINLLQGKVDISMRVKGSKGAGTLYFTSIRKEKGQPFTILRFKLICDNGVVLENLHRESTMPIS